MEAAFTILNVALRVSMIERSVVRPFDISQMGEGAILLHSSSPLDLGIQEIIWQIARQAVAWPGVLETVPGVNNILLLLDPEIADLASLKARLDVAWAAAGRWTEASTLIELPVAYGGSFGPDLPALSDFTGLSPLEIIDRHAAPTYVVLAVGGQPGFGYLGGLDPSLAMPRRSSPRPRVEVGSVGIGGSQTAVITATSPSGWHLIGRTDRPLFDARADRPALLSAGDRVRFIVESVSI